MSEGQTIRGAAGVISRVQRRRLWSSDVQRQERVDLLTPKLKKKKSDCII